MESIDLEKLPSYLQRRYTKLQEKVVILRRKTKEEIGEAEKAWKEFKEKNSETIKQHNLAKQILQEKGQLSVNENCAYQLIEEHIEKYETVRRNIDLAYEKEHNQLKAELNRLIEEGKDIEQRQIDQDSENFETPKAKPKSKSKPKEDEQAGATIADRVVQPNKDNSQEPKKKKLSQARKDELRGEIHHLDNQVACLQAKVVKLRDNLQQENLSDYNKAVLEREVAKIRVELEITTHRLGVRHRIRGGDRVDFDEESEREYSDGGYSSVDSDEEYHHNFPIRDRKVRRNRNRVPKVDKRDYITMNELKWSLKDIPKFYGDRRQGESASTHLMEFNDFLRNIEVDLTDETEAVNTKLIGYFMQSLKGRARQWFDLTFSEVNRRTFDHWKAIQNAFAQEYNPVGSTREQQIKAWKEMKWDPATESLTDFVYKYKELGKYLGYPEDQMLQSFFCCIPNTMFVYVMNARSLTEAVNTLKKCLALGTSMVPETKKDAEKTPVIPFMMATEAERIKNNVEKVVEEKVNSLTQAVEGKLETLSVALDKFQSDSRDRQQRRDSQYRGRDQRPPFQGRPSGDRGGRFNPRNQQDKSGRPFCTYCKKDGHTIDRCWTLEAKNAAQRGGQRSNFQNRFGNQNRFGGQNRFRNNQRNNPGNNRGFGGQKGQQKKAVANVVKDVVKELQKNGVQLKQTN